MNSSPPSSSLSRTDQLEYHCKVVILSCLATTVIESLTKRLVKAAKENGITGYLDNRSISSDEFSTDQSGSISSPVRPLKIITPLMEPGTVSISKTAKVILEMQVLQVHTVDESIVTYHQLLNSFTYIILLFDISDR
jgi:hypothetical protein